MGCRYSYDVNENEPEYLDDAEFFKHTLLAKLGRCVARMIDKRIKLVFVKRALVFIIFLVYAIYLSNVCKWRNPFHFLSVESNDTKHLYENYIFSNNKSLAIIVITLILGVLFIWEYGIQYLLIRYDLASRFSRTFRNTDLFENLFYFAQLFFILAVIIFELDSLSDFIPLVGLFSLIFLSLVISENPTQTQPRTIIGGLFLQISLGLLVLRTDMGYYLFKFIGDQMQTFLFFTDSGVKLVFGDKFEQHFIAFKALPVLIFFSSCINVLYHFGILQYVVLKFSWLINKFMNTSPSESITIVMNVFVGMSEAPLIVKPFFSHLTKSEYFSIMTGGYATVAGYSLAAYIGFGIKPNHLIIASIMSAPAALLVSKVIYPETEVSGADWNMIRRFPKGTQVNVLQAISDGAILAGTMIGKIIANLIAFVSMFKMFDLLLVWFFSFIRLENFGFGDTLKYLFFPFAFIMGTPFQDCLAVGKLLGLKVFINEYVAYYEMGKVLSFRNQLLANTSVSIEQLQNSDINIPNDIAMIWSEKSILVATYAICGFSNFGSIAIQMATLSSLAPHKSKIFSSIAFKSMIAGNIACFMTACVASFLHKQ